MSLFQSITDLGNAFMGRGFLSPELKTDVFGNKLFSPDLTATLSRNKFLSPDLTTTLSRNRFLSPEFDVSIEGEITGGGKNTSITSKKMMYYAPINIFGSPYASAAPSFTDVTKTDTQGGRSSLFGDSSFPFLLLAGGAVLLFLLSGEEKWKRKR